MSKLNKTKQQLDMNTPSWTKIGEHSSRAVLKKTVAKIRAKWLDRYLFKISEKSEQDDGYELHIKHR